MVITNYNLYLFIFNIITILISTNNCDINIHIIPHTHLDPGWLYTADEYYEQENIINIFNTITKELYEDKNKLKTFVINEIYYFKRWYEGASLDYKLKIKELIKEKRLEFVSGGFVVNDEATPSYKDIIDQYKIGHQFLLENFNITPKTAWYIDSFGHSAGNAYLMKKLNFENLILGRLHLDYLELLKNNNSTEFYWQPFEIISNETIFTHILPIHYGFNLFQVELGNADFCNNVKNNFFALLSHLKEAYKGLKHNNIMFLYGDDFQFSDNHLFINIECLIDGISNNQDKDIQKNIKEAFGISGKINIFYSTPENYFKTVKNELIQNNINLEILKNIDFYPLKTDCFWTGYFTSRPFLKGYIRKASNAYYSLSKYLSMIRLLNKKIYINKENTTMANIKFFREMVSLTQHHDAITGTCKQYVSEDYISNLKNIIKKVEINFKENLEKNLNIKIGSICYNNYIVDQKLCSSEFMIKNIIKGKDRIKIGIFNPMIASSSLSSNNLLINIEIYDSYTSYEVEGIKSDFFCINKYNLKDTNFFKYRNKCFLNFFYNFKKDQQIAYITLKKLLKGKKVNRYYSLNTIKNQSEIELITNNYNIKKLLFNPTNFEFYIEYYNELQKLTKLNFTYYDGMYYGNADNCKDGAYQFSPYNKYPEKIDIDYENSFYFIGNLGITFVVRNIEASFTFFTLFYNPLFIKVEHYFNSVQESYFLKKFSFGYCFVFKTNINNMNNNNKPIFYTDSNGLEMMKRQIDTFNYKESANITTGANFYPVTSSISIKDENNKENNNIVTIFNDRPQGGTGLLPGALILVIQRMSYGSDNKGLTENLWEIESMNNNYLKTTHFVVFGLNIFNENNNKTNMIKKTDLLNFIYNYFNSGVFLFRIEKEGKKLKQKIYDNNKFANNMFEKYIKSSPDIRVNYQVILNNLIIGEFFRYNNFFFNINHNQENNGDEEINFGNIILNFPDKVPFKVFFDKNGIDYNINQKNILNDIQKEKLIILNNQSFKLNYNEILFIYFYFENDTSI